MNEFMPIIVEMMRNPPDPNEPIPLANRLQVPIGVSVPFFVYASADLGSSYADAHVDKYLVLLQ